MIVDVTEAPQETLIALHWPYKGTLNLVIVDLVL